jgi:hypothetical protein
MEEVNFIRNYVKMLIHLVNINAIFSYAKYYRLCESIKNCE